MYKDWSQEFALQVLKENIRSLDGEYDDENDVFFDVRHGDDSLVVLVTDGVEGGTEEFVITFS